MVAELRKYGCDLVQGFHFARPMTAQALVEFLGGASQRRAGERASALGDG